jgi:hypothetical protein
MSFLRDKTVKTICFEMFSCKVPVQNRPALPCPRVRIVPSKRNLLGRENDHSGGELIGYQAPRLEWPLLGRRGPYKRFQGSPLRRRVSAAARGPYSRHYEDLDVGRVSPLNGDGQPGEEWPTGATK